MAGRAAFCWPPAPARSDGRGHPVDRFRAPRSRCRHCDAHQARADRHRCQRPAVVPSRAARRGSGYGVPYGESRECFLEAFDVILRAWTKERFSHQGKYFSCSNLSVVPKPYQKPHPPIWVAATTVDTFPMVGRMGCPIVTGLRGFDIPQVAKNLDAYRSALRDAGHTGEREVHIRIPIYVAETVERARAEPEASTVRAYRRLAENFASSVGAAGTTGSEDRAQRAARLSQ